MRIAMIPTSNNGVVFFRMHQYAEMMRKLGHSVCLPNYNFQIPFDKGQPWQDELDQNTVGLLGDLCDKADVVIWQMLRTRDALNVFLEFKKAFKKPFLTEIDDYIIQLPRGHVSNVAYHMGSQLVDIGLRQFVGSDGLIVSTPYLKKMYEQYNANINVIENCIDVSRWEAISPRPPAEDINIGWVGGGSHTPDLQLIKDVILKMVERDDVRFTCMHGVPEFFKGHPKITAVTEYKNIMEYPQWVLGQHFDIGVAPLVDNDFNRSKSNLRWLEYSAQKIPTVASNISHFRETITHGKDGFLVDNQEEWFQFLTLLVENEKLRRKMGKKAFKTLRKRFDLKKVTKKYLRVLEDL